MSCKALNLTGDEVYDIHGITEIAPGGTVELTIHRQTGETATVSLKVRIDTGTELEYYRHAGILAYVLRQKMA
jgi:aconitate hydratase